MNPGTTNAVFVRLIKELAELTDLKLPTPKSSPDEPLCVEFSIEEIAVRLLHLPQHDPRHFTAIYRFGALPSDAGKAMRRALEINYLTAQSTGTVLGIDPVTSEMMFSIRMPLLAMEPDALLDSMAESARLARQWRSSFFLDRPPAPLGNGKQKKAPVKPGKPVDKSTSTARTRT